jgi:response regulator RpfG family c-di-GMP phosphodiesterase
MGHYKNELSDEEIEFLFKAAPLHDIGKVGIPDHILLKNGSLNDEEWQTMKTHASIGEIILSSAGPEFQGDENVIRTAFKIAGGHHEKWDGTGYPRNLSGQDIPLSARIMALADVYDALVSKRVYKRRWSHQEAIKEIVSKKGQHFDPLVVDAFILEEDQFLAISRQYEDS